MHIPDLNCKSFLHQFMPKSLRFSPGFRKAG
jgi:hypothetical protein